MIIMKRFGIFLVLLVVVAIGQLALFVDLASAAHNCWRPPYHCFFAFGTYETTNSVAHATPTQLPQAILVENVLSTSSDSVTRRVFIYTTDSSNKTEVDLAEDAKEYFDSHPNETTGRGFMALSRKDGKWLLVEFHPSDPGAPSSGSSTDEESLRNWIRAFEQALLQK